MPTITSMRRHWMRSCWVCTMWYNTTCENTYENVSIPETSGWSIDEAGEYSIDWESPEVMNNIDRIIQFLTKGCTCKKGCNTDTELNLDV